MRTLWHFCLTIYFQKTISRARDGKTWASRRKIACTCTVCVNDKPNGEDKCCKELSKSENEIQYQKQYKSVLIMLRGVVE